MNRFFQASVAFALCLSLFTYGCDTGDGETMAQGGSGGEAGMGGSAGSGGNGGSGDSDGGASDGGAMDAEMIATPCVSDEMCPEDQYCRTGDGPGSQICGYGCREDGCGDGRVCDLERRNCIRDTSCSADEDCAGGEYCNAGECADGCRIGNEDDCPRNEEGMPRTCHPDTHECVLQVVCCGAENACSLELPEECDTPLPGERGCFNPNPCRLLCEEDADCESGLYCNEDGRCVEGCRTVGVSGCRDDRICDGDTRECIRPPCALDDDCPNDMFCDAVECIPGCRLEPDNCRRGEYCDAERRRCVDDAVPQDCADDAQCEQENGPGWFCDGQDCQPPCQGHEECPAGQACGPDGRCFEGCRDDDYEENDERGLANELRFDGNTFDSGEQQLYVCSRDPDWYTFETPAEGMTIDVNVSFIHADGNLDVRLYGPDGELVAGASTQDDDESIRLASEAEDPLPQGRFWLEIYPRGFDENSYRFTVNLARGLGPDDAEPDDGANESTILELPDLQQQVEVDDRTIHPNDEDWFAVDMGERDGITIRLDMLGNDSGRDDELTFELYGPGFMVGDQALVGPTGGGENPNGTRYVDFVARRFNGLIRDGRYYVRVFGLNQRQVGRYRLTVSVDRENILCLADAAEPNDAQETAHDLMARDEFTRIGFDGVRELRPGQDLVLPALNLCNDEDWYQVSLRQNDSLEVRLERQEAEVRGDTHVRIYDSNGAVVGEGLNGNAVNIARVEGAADGTYFIRLESRGMTRTAYNLALFRTAGALPCAPDRYDAAGANDARASASAVVEGNYNDLALCGADDDEDWYSFNVDTLSTVTVAIRFAHAQGDLDLDLFYGEQPDSLNGAMPAGHSVNDDEVVVFENRAPGNYQVRVRSIGQSNVRYSLEVTVEARVFACMDDPDEPNNTFAQATDLGDRVVDPRENQWICERRPIDEDTYYFVVPPGVSRTVAASFLYGDDGDLFLQLFDPDEMALLSTSNIERGNSKQCMLIPASNVARGFYLRVVPRSINSVQQNDERLDYNLTIRPGEDCNTIDPADGPVIAWPILGD